MSIRAKFQVTSIESVIAYGGGKQEVVKLTVVNDEANRAWSQYTPQGRIELHITNPAAVDQLPLGKHFYVDFTEAPAVDPKPAN